MVCKQLFVVVFEGRTGSSELVCRLNSHPEILCYPEVLAPISGIHSTPESRWADIPRRMHEIANGTGFPADLVSYNKSADTRRDLPVVGLKTRLNEPVDREWFRAVGKEKNFYVIEHGAFRDLMLELNAKLIRLRRNDLLAGAISWLRAVRLDSERNRWNIAQGEADLAPVEIDLRLLDDTLVWMEGARVRHDHFFDNYLGDKLAVSYEAMIDEWPKVRAATLGFLGLADRELVGRYKKITDRNLAAAVSNIDELRGHLSKGSRRHLLDSSLCGGSPTGHRARA